MSSLLRVRTVALAAFIVVAASPAAAQQADAGLTAEMVRVLDQVEQKLVALAEAFPADVWDWSPGEGVRSTGEVFQHVAADNWFLPTVVEVDAPEETGIRANDYPSVQAYEGRSMSRDEIMDELKRSFAHAKEAVRNTAGQPDREVKLFGNDVTARGLWIITTTHIHEHLGQLIAYARTNGIVPPWSS